MPAMLETRLKINKELLEAKNLAGRFTATDLATISSWVWEGFTKDKASRRTWEDRNSAAMDLAMQIQEAKNFPWVNCSNIIFPLLTIAALQFSTRSYSNLIRGTQLFKYKVWGDDPAERKQSKLIGKHLSWQVLEEDQAWEEQHDRLFINVSVVGSAFIKTRFADNVKHNTSRLVMARDLVMDYHASSVEDCRRKTEVIKKYRNEIIEGVRRGTYRDVTKDGWFLENARVGAVESLENTDHDKRVGLDLPQGDEDTPFICLEQHRWMDCDGDGYEEPYIVLIESASREVLRIVARVDRMEDIETNEHDEIICIRADEYYTKYGFIPAPDGGIYDMGFGVLLGPLNETVNTAINQIFDAGTSNMLGGGFAVSGAKLRAGVYTRTPGEFKIIKGASDDIRKSLIQWPEIPISNVLFQVLSLVIQYADRLAGSTETLVGENPGQNTPAQTYQGMVDNGLQIYKSIFKRIWRSMKEEGKKLHLLNARFMPDSQSFGKKGEKITREAYKSNPDMVVPLADPNLISDQQRIMRSQTIRQGAHSVPGYNIEEVERDYLEAMGHDDIDRIYPGPYSDWYKEHPLPNPKMQVEQVKLQGTQMKLEHDKWKVVATLMAGQKKIAAEIDFIRAQAAKIVSDIGADKAAQQLEAFDMVMTHLSALTDGVNEQIKGLLEPPGGQTSGEDQGGGAGRTQAQPGGPGPVGVPAQASGQSQGAMG